MKLIQKNIKYKVYVINHCSEFWVDEERKISTKWLRGDY